MYYQLYCNQNNEYMNTGRNSTSKEEVKEALLSYLSADHDDEQLENYRKNVSPDELAGYYEFEIHETKEMFENLYNFIKVVFVVIF